jgi:hypothetical protein
MPNRKCSTQVFGSRLVMKTDRSHGNKFSLQAGPANAANAALF